MASILENIKRRLVSKNSLPEETVETDTRAHENEEEIIDLVDSLEKDSVTPNDMVSSEEEPVGILSEVSSDEKTEIDLQPGDDVVDELEDTLDEELIKGDAWRSPQTLTSENMTDRDLEEALLELFESGELIASEIIEEGLETGGKNEEHFSVDSDRLHDSPVDLEITADSIREKDTTGKRPEPEDAIPANLFVGIKLEKGGPDEMAFTAAPPASRRESEMTNEKIAWIDSDQYYPIALQALNKRIVELKQEVRKIATEKEELKKKFEVVRSILYLKGEELRKAVAEVFSDYWSLKLSHIDKTKSAGFKENILIEHNGRDILAKIKGTHKDHPSIKYIAEVWKDLYYSGLGTSVEGVLIVNYGLEKNPKERNLAYEEDEDQFEDLIFIDTRVLYNLTTAIVDEELSIEEAKRILFKKGRVKYNIAD